jgi:hypothetical protein
MTCITCCSRFVRTDCCSFSMLVAPPIADYSALYRTTCQAFSAVFSAFFKDFS